MLKKIVLHSVLLFMVGIVYSQQNNHAFTFGEKVTYDVYYNWQFVWLKAAKVTFEVKNKTIDGESHYHFYSKGGTLPNYDWIYTVKDQYQAIAHIQTLTPLKSSRNIHEGKNIFINENDFDYQNNQIVSRTAKEGEALKIDTIKMKNPAVDVLSAIYICRNIDYSNLKVKDTVPLLVVINDEIFSLYIRFLGYEPFVDLNEKQYNTIKFSVLLVEGTIFSGGEDMTVWVTNDKNRIPINVEAKILVGSIHAVLREVSGVKHQ